MDVVRELRRKQDDLRCDRQALADQMAEIDDQIAAFDAVFRLTSRIICRRRKNPVRTGNAAIFSTDCS
jgi:hypothetical protein